MEKIITPTELQEVDFDLTRNRVLGTKTKYQREQADSKKNKCIRCYQRRPKMDEIIMATQRLDRRGIE